MTPHTHLKVHKVEFDHALVHGNCHPHSLVCPAVLAELEGLGKVSADSSERGKTAAVGAGAKSVDFNIRFVSLL